MLTAVYVLILKVILLLKIIIINHPGEGAWSRYARAKVEVQNMEVVEKDSDEVEDGMHVCTKTIA